MTLRAGHADGRPAVRWHLTEDRIQVRGEWYRLRLLAVPEVGWLASVDTVEGPTLGCDHSRYLAIGRAIEPIGGRLLEALSLRREVGSSGRPHDAQPQ